MEYTLENVKILSIEIGDSCNLSHIHNKCPINKRKYKNKKKRLTKEKVIEIIDEATKLGFKGHIAFHYYNEPLLYKEKMKEIILCRPDVKYLLWTNGLLFDEQIEKNDIIELFEDTVITCYKPEKMIFFEKLAKYYRNIHIVSWELDDRLVVYEQPKICQENCQRAIFEFPIDYYGNVHLCCEDWNNEYELGNVYECSLKEIVNSIEYVRTQKMNTELGLDYEMCPEICKKCSSIDMRQDIDIDKL